VKTEDSMDEEQIAAMTFESAMAGLEDVLDRIESSDLTLDETLVLFARGTQLARRCGELLDKAELRVTELLAAMQCDAPSDEEG
jgi:exodeoxyribonuclease VII small subunit